MSPCFETEPTPRYRADDTEYKQLAGFGSGTKYNATAVMFVEVHGGLHNVRGLLLRRKHALLVTDSMGFQTVDENKRDSVKRNSRLSEPISSKKADD